ncbi:MAG: sugar transferase [Bryobacteraceae bacterium]
MSSQPNSYEAFGYNIFPLTDSSLLWRSVGVLERSLACILLILCGPLFGAVCLITLFLSRRSPLVAHRRVGKNGQEIWVFKLRTMWGVEARKWSRLELVEYLRRDVVPECKPKCDPRITSSFAAFCRKYSIDEVPQLWLVARGEMSVVGPRPMTRGELVKHYGPDAARLLCMKPGLTGLWQIRGRSNLNYRQRRRLDMFMLRKWSLSLYTAILIASIPKVFTGKDAW